MTGTTVSSRGYKTAARVCGAIALAIAIAATTSHLVAQGQGSQGQPDVLVPDTSIEQPGDRGHRAHTNHVISLRGATELLRTVSNPLADAAFLVGLVHLTRGSAGRVILAASVPGMVHAVVLVLQLTLALLLLEGGAAQNRDVAIAAVAGWLIILGAVVGVRLARGSSGGTLARVRSLIEAVNFRAFLPMLAWFVVLAVLDVGVQWLGTRAFGVPIDFLSLVARIPILYIAFLIPSFGNFGTRELVWASLFDDIHDRDRLIAYAFATNTLFLVFHVLIGAVFLPRALALLREVREANRAGEEIPHAGPLLHDPGER